MYSFQTNVGRRKSKRLLRILCPIIFLLIIALVAVSIAYSRSVTMNSAIGEALRNRALDEAASAQSSALRLTQSSGTNSLSWLSDTRSHIYALQTVNTIASNIYGTGTVVVDSNILNTCINIISQCEARMQAGGVLTELYTNLRDQIDLIVTALKIPDDSSAS